jgi:hypothetical protein
VTEGLAKTSMNALLTLITASSAASILAVDSGVTATLDSGSTRISGHVLVSLLLKVYYVLHFSVTVIISDILYLQISMSVPPVMVVVAKSVPTRLEHFSVAATVDIG